jgi:hypothetical protein
VLKQDVQKISQVVVQRQRFHLFRTPKLILIITWCSQTSNQLGEVVLYSTSLMAKVSADKINKDHTVKSFIKLAKAKKKEREMCFI